MIKVEKCEKCNGEIQIKWYDTIQRFCSDKCRKKRFNK